MIRKVAIKDLRPGMEVIQMSSDVWTFMPHLYTEPGMITSKSQILRIQKEGYQHAFVHLLEPGETVEEPMEKRLEKMLETRKNTPPSKPRAPFETALPQAEKAYEAAIHHSRRLINDVKMGKNMDYNASVEVVEDIVDSIIQNPNTLLCLSKLADHDEYTFSHSINVATIATIFGEYLGLSHSELTLLGLAGLMHDVGKTAVPNRIINKRSRLTEEEFKTVQKHPRYGSEILEKQGDVPRKVIEAVRDHHEKYNGGGYPQQIPRPQIPAFARIISLADVYDALTSDRSYKDAILPNKALAIMYGMREQDFDPLEVQMFIKCLGIFPSGSLVKLNTGFYGLVYESNPTLPLMPKIKIILDEDLRPIPSELVDLAAAQAIGDDKLEILECADPSTYKLNLKAFLTRKRA